MQQIMLFPPLDGIPVCSSNADEGIQKMEQALAYQFSKDELEEGDKEPLMSDKKWSIRDIAWLLTIGFGITFVTTAFSQAGIPRKLLESWKTAASDNWFRSV